MMFGPEYGRYNFIAVPLEKLRDLILHFFEIGLDAGDMVLPLVSVGTPAHCFYYIV
jgi:hypothetical protein